MKKKLLLITPFFHPNVGGVETRLNDLIGTMTSHGHGIVVMTYQPLTSPVRGRFRENSDQVAVWRLPWPGRDIFHRLLKWPALEVLYLVPGLMLMAFFYMLFHFRSIDTIHTPGLNAAIVGRFLKMLFRTRWVVSTHSIYEMQEGTRFAEVVRWVLQPADAIVALSEPSRRELLEIGLAPERVSVELTWIDLELFRPMAKRSCRKQLGIDGDRFVVLFVGRLLPEKGVDLVLGLAARLPGIVFVIVGSGPEQEKVEECAGRLRNIVFQGFVEQKLLPCQYNAADLFILPSLYREGLGRVVIEALACGLPVMMSETAAIWPLVNDAAYCAPARVEDMARLIERLAGRADDYERKRTMARTIATEKFNSKNILGLYRAYGWET